MKALLALKNMALEPLTTSLMYIGGRKIVDNSTDYLRDGVISASASVASGYLMSPIDRFFD